MQKNENSNVVVLGNFDGVHLGHKKLIKSAINYAKDNNLKTVIYIFRNFPYKTKNITNLEEKIDILNSLGVDQIYIDEFDNVKNLSEEEFVQKVLKDKLNASMVFCGFNYTYAYNKSGNAKSLSQLINTTIIDAVKVNDITVSSTLIRKCIEIGYIELANMFLGHEYHISGIVVKGKQIGRTIGFPTANIIPYGSKIYPPYGVYGTRTVIEDDNKIYTSMMNLGDNPTIDSKNSVTIETNIFDFNRDIYDKKIKVILYRRLRCETKFKSLEELKEQINLDKLNWSIHNVKY